MQLSAQVCLFFLLLLDQMKNDHRKWSDHVSFIRLRRLFKTDEVPLETGSFNNLNGVPECKITCAV